MAPPDEIDPPDEQEIPLDEEAIEELGADELLDAENEDDGPSASPQAPPPTPSAPPPRPPTQTSPPPSPGESPRPRTATRPPPPPSGGSAMEAIVVDGEEAPVRRSRGMTMQIEALSMPRRAPRASQPPEDEPPARVEDAPAPDPDPLAEPLDQPTVLDKLIAGDGAASAEARADALTRELDASTSKERVGALAYELGELCERHLGDEARAVKAFGRALQADPSLRSNLWAIRRVFYRRGLWPNLVKLIGAETRFADGDTGRADLLVEKGHILEDQVGETAEARTAYEQAIAADPRCVPALQGLERLALRAGDDATLENAWTLLADATATPARKQTYYLDLVRLCGERGGEHLDRARDFMKRALDLGGQSDRLARAREWLAERSGEPGELMAALDARALELMARFGPAGPSDPENTDPGGASSRLRRQVVAIRRRQARIASGELGDADRAWNYLQQATELLPGEPLLAADLADLAERLGKYDELAELVETWESQEADPGRALSLSLRRADALFRAGHDDAARALLATLSATQPGYVPILALRERDALASADSTALAETYVSAAEAARTGQGFGPGAAGTPDPRTAAGYFVTAGDLYRHRVRTPDLARARYAQALEAVPGYPPAVEALAALHESAGRFDDALALYELHSESGEPAFRAHVLERLTEIYQRVGKLDEVEGALRRLIALQPDEPGHRWRLEEVLASLGRPRERAEVLLELAEKVDDPDRRIAALLEAARAFDDELGDVDRAIPLYRQVAEAWPTDPYARHALALALRRGHKWEELVTELRAEAAAAPSDAAAARALREASAVLLDRLDRAADAAQVCRELVERRPGDADALRALAEALVRAGDQVGALDALEREVDARGEGPGAVDAISRLAEQAERVGRADEAETAWRRALTLDASAARAAVAQLDLAVVRRNPAGEVDALVRLAESPVGLPVAAELLERAGWLAALAGGETAEGAARLFERAVELEPGRRGALLGRLLVEARGGDPTAQGDALGDLAASLPGSYAAASLLLRAAVIAEVQRDEEGVEARMSRALGAAPTDPGTLVAAAEYLPPPGPSTGAIAASGRVEGLVRRAEAYGARAALAADPASMHDWQIGQAELFEAVGRLGDAARVVGQVLTQRPDDVRALQLIRRVCRRGGDRDSLARASAQLGGIIGDREGRVELLREAAAIFDHELGHTEHAVPTYRRLLVEEPTAPEYERLHEILSSADDIAGLFEILSQRIHALESGARGAPMAAALVERARIRLGLGDDRGAARDLGIALEIEPRHQDALYLRGGALKRLGRADEAAKCLERFLEDAGDDERRPQAELALSDILADSNDLAGAIVQLGHVARQQPNDVPVRERLIDLLIRSGEHRRAAEELRNIERLRESTAEKARDQMRLARLLRDAAGDRDGAVTALERARGLEPLALEPVRQLVELFPGDGARRSQVLSQAASELREAIAEDPGKIALYERLAAVAQWMGDDEARAVALEAQEAQGSINSDARGFLADWRGRRRLTLDASKLGDPLHPTEWQNLRDPGAGGLPADVWALIEPAVAAAMPSDPSELGFARGDRIKGKDLDKRYPLVLPLLRTFGSEEPEIFVSDKKAGAARVVGGEKRALLLGADIAAAATPQHRFTLGRAVTLLKEGTGVLADLEDDEVAGWFAAAAELSGAKVQLPSGTDQRRHADRMRHLDKKVGRRERKALSALTGRMGELGDVREWRRAALRTAARAGMVLGGELPAALDMLDIGRGARSLAGDRGALSLLAFAASAEHLELRRRLGLKRA